MTGVLAGFSSNEITPEGDNASPAWPLRARLAVFDDGSRRIAIAALDLEGGFAADQVAALREEIALAANALPAAVLISCTHTHSAPRSDRLFDLEGDPTYFSWLTQRVADAARSAAQSLRPVSLRCASAEALGVTFNRRAMYLGNEVATLGPVTHPDFIEAEGPSDPGVQILLALDATNAVVGGFVGFASHPTIMVAEPGWSADFTGAVADHLTQLYGGTFVYLQGACGDLTPACWIENYVSFGANAEYAQSLLNVWDGPSEVVRMRDSLVAATQRATATSTPISAAPVRATQEMLLVERRWPTQAQAELARWFLEQDTGNVDLDDIQVKLTGHKFTFFETGIDLQRIYAREIIRLWTERCQAGPLAPTAAIEIQVLSVGDVAFVGYPGEMFAEYGLQTKSESPFPVTFVCAYANGMAAGYVPSRRAFDHGGFETRLGVSRLVPEGGDLMVNAALAALRSEHAGG